MSKIVFAGAGPVGCLAAIHFKRAGFDVELYERRPDIRQTKIPQGRSINLALSKRGISALNELGVKTNLLKNAVPMRARMMHTLDGKLIPSAYGINDSFFINSISRAELNYSLLDFAEKVEKIPVHFSHRVTDYDFEKRQLKLEVLNSDGSVLSQKAVPAPHVIASDGSSSALRNTVVKHGSGKSEIAGLGYAYKELTIPALSDGRFQMEENFLHIWPRGNFMLIALPNKDGSFTCTLFLAESGTKNSFESLKTPKDVRDFFSMHFPDTLNLISNLEESFFSNPTGNLATVRCHPWNVRDQILLIGDASHGIVPFFGQGLNCGFEDCSFLRSSLENTKDLSRIFDEFSDKRKQNTDAIADLALDNFLEMRDKVGQPRFLFEKEIERELMRRFPDRYFSRYFLVTFTKVPYALALKVGAIQDRITHELSEQKNKIEEVNFDMGAELISKHLEPLNAEIRPFLKQE